jgi:hypothetical protein
MGGGGSWSNPSHTWHEETVNVVNNQWWAQRYQEYATAALNAIYNELEHERNVLRADAFAKAIKALTEKKEIEWKIFELQVKKAQANYISGLYTNQILSELRNLEDILKQS